MWRGPSPPARWTSWRDAAPTFPRRGSPCHRRRAPQRRRDDRRPRARHGDASRGDRRAHRRGHRRRRLAPGQRDMAEAAPGGRAAARDAARGGRDGRRARTMYASSASPMAASTACRAPTGPCWCVASPGDRSPISWCSRTDATPIPIIATSPAPARWPGRCGCRGWPTPSGLTGVPTGRPSLHLALPARVARKRGRAAPLPHPGRAHHGRPERLRAHAGADPRHVRPVRALRRGSGAERAPCGLTSTISSACSAPPTTPGARAGSMPNASSDAPSFMR